MTSPLLPAAKVFVSHSHKDDDFAMKFAADLSAAGVEVWVDKREIRYDDFIKWINQGLAQSHWLVLVMTPDSLQSSWVETEVNAALSLVKHGRMRGVIPIVARPCNESDIPAIWAVLHRYDAVRDYQATLSELLSLIAPNTYTPSSMTGSAILRPVQSTSASPSTLGSVGNQVYVYKGHSGRVKALSWSPDGRYIASAGEDCVVQVWTPLAERPLQTVYDGHSRSVMSVTWSPDGAVIASAGADGQIHVWHARTAQLMMKLAPMSVAIQGPQSCVIHHVAWSPDSKRIACVAFIRLESAFHVTDSAAWIWDVTSGSVDLVYRGPSSQGIGMHGLAWAPDGGRIACEGGSELLIWDPRSGTTLLATEIANQVRNDGPRSLAWSRDGTRIATGHDSQKVRVWSASTAISPLVTCPGRSGRVNSLTWSPDSSRIAAGTDRAIVQLWDARTGAALSTYGDHASSVTAVAWSPDSNRIASSSDDQTVHVARIL